MAAIRTAEGRESNGFSYFMIRLSPGAGEVSGVVERIGTGEKRTFASGQELVTLVSGWPAVHPPAVNFDGAPPAAPAE